MTTTSTERRESSGLDVAGAAPVRHPLRLLASIGVLVLVSMLGHMLVTNPNFQWDVVAAWFTAETVMRGLAMTLMLTVIAMVIGVLLGILIAVARMSGNPLLSTLASAYVWLFRAIPELVQLLFWFNLAALLPRLSIGIPFGPEFTSWSTNSLITPLMAAILGLGLLEAAYMAEIVRGGLLSVDHGQVEAAKALGMGSARSLRRIVLPQAMRFIVPPTGSQVIRMVKGTSLVSVIALADLLYSVQVVYNRTFETIPLLIVACGWYLILNSILFVVQDRIERYYSRGSVGGSRSSLRAMFKIRRPRRTPDAAIGEGQA
jgi:polar amino acid transport system permease protein